jgi:hypothetical protein
MNSLKIEVYYRIFVIRIRDRGGGMPRSLLDKIFDYHFSSYNYSSTLSYTEFDNLLYDQLGIRNNPNSMSG